MSASPAEIPDRFGQISDEQEEDWPRDAWTRASLDRLWAQYGETIPWNDAGPESKSGSDEEEPPGFPAAGEETAA